MNGKTTKGRLTSRNSLMMEKERFLYILMLIKFLYEFFIGI